MKTIILYFFNTLYILIFSLLFISCKKGTGIATNRSFYIGVTPWPADFTLAELDTSYSFINSHCDIVSHHFDEGIPYEEAYKNSTVPVALKQDMDFRMAKTASSQKILLSVSALNLTRKEKSDYYDKSIVSDSIKNYWKQLAFDDTKIVTSYVNYMGWLIDGCRPDFINFGVESNNPLWDPVAFGQYKNFISKVYTQLKAKYPSIPLMVSFMVDENAASLSNAKQLLPYTDYIALSAYPYLTVSSSATGNTNPDLFPADLFERFIKLDTGKPLAFAETGYLAEPLNLPALSLQKEGNEEWQDKYLKLILDICQLQKARFMIWFCSKDYDAAVIRLQQQGNYQTLFSFWKDTGLKNERGSERMAMKRWKDWMSRQKTGG